MLTDPKDIRKTFNKNGDLIIEDDYVNKDFVMKFLNIQKNKAYEILNECRKQFKNKDILIMEGKATLSSFYKKMGLKGRFE